ncbi:MAG: PhoU domain-containing protein [Phycisphaerae bacterium]
MWQQILSALKGTDAIGEMISQVGQMIEGGQWMFGKSSEVLMRRVDWDSIAEELYARDREVNQIEQGIREGVVTHLSMGNESDLAACLILMSVVKDAERIGDYCKNIFEVGKFYRQAYTHPQYAGPLDETRAGVEPLFAKARKAFVEADRGLARQVIDTSAGLRRTCDMLIQQLLSTDERMPADEAVAYVLLARFYKRVAAHLGNIASSVVAPVPLIDYHDEKRLQNA